MVRRVKRVKNLRQSVSGLPGVSLLPHSSPGPDERLPASLRDVRMHSIRKSDTTVYVPIVGLRKRQKKEKITDSLAEQQGCQIHSLSFFPPSGKASTTSRYGSVLGSVTGCEEVHLGLSSCPWVSYSWLWKIKADGWTLRSFSARWFGCKIFPHWWLLSRFLINWDRLESLPWATRTISEVCFQPLYLLCLPFSCWWFLFVVLSSSTALRGSFILLLRVGTESCFHQCGND